jgi:type I restriction enzyme S subunit
LSSGGGQPNVNQEKIASLKVSAPDYTLQTKIANFLDYETAKADTLIEKQKQLIQLLKEKRQAVISHAVTKGFDPKVKMRESRIEWLGDVPAHWALSQPRFVCSFVGGGTPMKENPEFWDGDIPWVSPKDMKKDYISTAQDKITPAALSQSAVKLIGAGAVLIVVRGMILDHSVPVALSEAKLTINQDMKALIPNAKMDGEYLLYCLKGMRDNILNLVDSSAHGTKCLRTEQFDRMVLPLPPLSEQLSITSQLKDTLSRFDKLILNTELMIELAVERRTALVSAAVTGKIDINDWIAPQAIQINREVAA